MREASAPGSLPRVTHEARPEVEAFPGVWKFPKCWKKCENRVDPCSAAGHLASPSTLADLQRPFAASA